MYRTIMGLVMLISMLAILPADAFTPGPSLIMECSECGQPLILGTKASGNNFGMRIWTDRYDFAPMNPRFPILIKCPACEHTLWVDSLSRVGSCEVWETKEQYPDAIMPIDPTEEDYLEIAEQDLIRNAEMFARVSSLWEANHEFRYGEADTFHLSEQQITNIKILMELLDEEDEGQRLVKAELARELGDFDESLRLLSQEVSAEFSEYRAFIEELSREGIREVREILDESEIDTNAE